MTNEKVPKVPKSFECEKCNYICCSKKDFNKHLGTRKHSSTNNANEMSQKIPKIQKIYVCQTCNNEYKHQSSLCKHAKTCQPKLESQPQPQPQLSDITTLTTLIMELVKNSTDVQKQVLELCKSGTTNNNNTINANINNNQKFNINVFLNEQCKDAINFSDFIKNIEVSREDLENNAQLGFVDGVSKILIDSLKQLDRSERPIHCTDVKRETMYIKDDDKWNKEEDSSKLNKAIQEVTRKSMGTLMNWKEENPDYKDRDSEFSERCIVIQQQSMAAHNRDTYFPKVVKAIAREVVVEK
jgi:phosphoglycerate-specific signal transduction histidine kinase